MARLQALIAILSSCHMASGLVPAHASLRAIMPRASISTRLPLVRMEEEFTEVQRLRAEAESPFSQVRLFAFPVLFAAAGIATYFGATGLLASSLGVRDPSPTGVQDLLIDLGSMGATGFLWRREVEARESKLRRISFGSQLAKLRLFQLVPDASASSLRPGQSASLSDLRRGRGQARRVVLVCATEATLQASLEGACAMASRLAASDFLVVPLLATGSSDKPQLAPPPLELLQKVAAGSTALVETLAAKTPERVATTTDTQPALPWDEAVPDAATGWPIALPQSGGEQWTSALGNDLKQAGKQDKAIMSRGFTIVLKKNGRVGTRRLGMPDWDGLVSDVEMRKLSGLDVVNI